jgi:hypothetical protein
VAGCHRSTLMAAGIMALRAKRLNRADHLAAQPPTPRTISVALCGSRSSSVLKIGRWVSADSAGMPHP